MIEDWFGWLWMILLLKIIQTIGKLDFNFFIALCPFKIAPKIKINLSKFDHIFIWYLIIFFYAFVSFLNYFYFFSSRFSLNLILCTDVYINSLFNYWMAFTTQRMNFISCVYPMSVTHLLNIEFCLVLNVPSLYWKIGMVVTHIVRTLRITIRLCVHTMLFHINLFLFL